MTTYTLVMSLDSCVETEAGSVIRLLKLTIVAAERRTVCCAGTHLHQLCQGELQRVELETCDAAYQPHRELWQGELHREEQNLVISLDSSVETEAG